MDPSCTSFSEDIPLLQFMIFYCLARQTRAAETVPGGGNGPLPFVQLLPLQKIKKQTRKFKKVDVPSLTIFSELKYGSATILNMNSRSEVRT
jgi:hypothetical protein